MSKSEDPQIKELEKLITEQFQEAAHELVSANPIRRAAVDNAFSKAKNPAVVVSIELRNLLPTSGRPIIFGVLQLMEAFREMGMFPNKVAFLAMKLQLVGHGLLTGDVEDLRAFMHLADITIDIDEKYNTALKVDVCRRDGQDREQYANLLKNLGR